MKRLFIALAAVTLIGCSGVTTRTEGVRFDREAVSNIKAGVTTRKDVLTLLGEPKETAFEEDGERLVYEFKEEKTPTYMGGLIENKLTSKTTSRTLEIVIKDGIVRSYRFKDVEE